MKLTAAREELLAPLQSVIGVVERRQTMPVLANVLLAARDNRLSVTGTDLEVELVATCPVSVQQPGDITVPGRKLLDIFRSLAEKTSVTVSTEGERVSVRAGRSRFTLSSLPAAEFPLVEEINAQQTLSVAQGEFRRLIDKTHFSMAQQDVRYYLNGLLLETDGKALRAVATDGHRLALAEMELSGKARAIQQVIVPRKGVLELQRILGTEGAIELAVGTNHVRAQIGEIRFTSKLIDGRFPEYARVIPTNPAHGSAGAAHASGAQPRAGGSRGSGRDFLPGRGSRDWIQCELSPRRPECDRERQGARRTHRLQQQLSHPRPRHSPDALRRDAHAPLKGRSPRDRGSPAAVSSQAWRPPRGRGAPGRTFRRRCWPL